MLDHPLLRRHTVLFHFGLLAWLGLCCLPLQAEKREDLRQRVSLLPWEAPSLELRTTAAWSGSTSEALFVAGAESTPAPDGSLVVFALPLKNKTSWIRGEISVPAWSSATSTPQTVYVVGGVKNGLTSPTVTGFKLVEGKIQTSVLPPLPQPRAGASAAVLKDKLYVYGGASSLQPLQIENNLYVLDLKSPTTGWKEAEPLPGSGRAFAASTVQYDSMCIFGGVTRGSDGNLVTSPESWLYRPKPPEASLRKGWFRQADLPRPLVGATAFPVGQSAVALLSGTETPAIPALTSGSPSNTVNSQAYLFHTITDAWIDLEGWSGGLDGVQVAKIGEQLDTKLLLISQESGHGTLSVKEFKPVRNVRSLSWIDYLVVVAYFSIISLIGYFASRKQKSSADFSLGGRKVPWWVAGISMFATGASAISFMAIPALAFATNLVFLFPVYILIISFFVQSRAIYPLLRRLEITSTYEYLEKRFNVTLRLIASAQCIIFQTFGRASIVLVLPSLALSATTGINVYLSVLVMGAITTIYTALGGFSAVVWTDLFQGILKMLAPLIMIGVCLFSLPGGAAEFWAVGQAHHKFDFAIFSWDATLPALWVLFLNTFLSTTIQQAGDQPVIQRVFSAPDKEVRRVAAMSCTCGILIATIVNTLGIAIFAYFHAHPGLLDPTAQNDKIVPLFVVQALPPGLVGMVIAAIFASAMTTVASSMNSSSTVFAEDFFMRANPNASDATRLRVLKTGSYVVGLIAVSIALLLATLNLKSIMIVWTQISALLGGGIVGLYSLGMFTKRANGTGAVIGAILSVVLTALVQFYTPLHWQMLLPTAILSCMFFGYLFSLFTPQDKDLTGLTIYTPAKKKDVIENKVG